MYNYAKLKSFSLIIIIIFQFIVRKWNLKKSKMPRSKHLGETEDYAI